MSTLTPAKGAYWTAMDAYLSSFPYDCEPTDLVQSMRESNQDNLPQGLIIHPAFTTVSLTQLADCIESHARTVSEHLRDIAEEASFVTAIDTICPSSVPNE